MISDIVNWGVVIVVVVGIISAAVKIIPEYERAVLFRLGRLVSVRGPGLIFIIPIVDQIVRISLRYPGQPDYRVN
jgi:regulator of protease activity HflC (stomatin/prohibitin superfamily)